MELTEFEHLPVYVERIRGQYEEKRSGYTSTGYIMPLGQALRLKNDAQRLALLEYQANGKTALYSTLKSYCPAIVPSASDMLDNRRPKWEGWRYEAQKRLYRNDANVVYSGLLCLDYDQLGAASCEDIITKLFAVGCLAASISLSGAGVAALFFYDVEALNITDAGAYAAFYAAAAEWINSQCGLAADLHDASCKNASRLRVLSGREWLFNPANQQLPMLSFNRYQKKTAIDTRRQVEGGEQSLWDFCAQYGSMDGEGNVHFLECPFAHGHSGSETPEQCTAVLWARSSRWLDGGFSCRHDSCQGKTINSVKRWALERGWTANWENMIFQGAPCSSQAMAEGMLLAAFNRRYRLYEDRLLDLDTGELSCKTQRQELFHQNAIKYLDEKGKAKNLTLHDLFRERSTNGLYVSVDNRIDLPAKQLCHTEASVGNDHYSQVYNLRQKYLLEQPGEPLAAAHYTKLMQWIQTRFQNVEEWQYYLNWIIEAVKPFMEGTPWDKNQTAIFLQGTQGSGKSTLAEDIPQALLGSGFAKCTGKGDQMFSNGFENSVFAVMNEKPAVADDDNLANTLKGLITEYTVDVRYMHKQRQLVRCYCNILGVSNKLAAIECEANDRRWSVFSIENDTCPLTGWKSSHCANATREESFPQWLAEVKSRRDPAYAKGLYAALKACITKTFNIKQPLVNTFKQETTLKWAMRNGFERWLVGEMLKAGGAVQLTTIKDWVSESVRFASFSLPQIKERLHEQEGLLWVYRKRRYNDQTIWVWQLTEQVTALMSDDDPANQLAIEEEEFSFPF